MLCGWEEGPAGLGEGHSCPLPAGVASQTRPRWRPGSLVRARGDRETTTHSGLQGTGAHSCGGAGRGVGVSGHWSSRLLHMCLGHRMRVICTGRGAAPSVPVPSRSPRCTWGSWWGMPRGEDHGGHGAWGTRLSAQSTASLLGA